MTAPWKTVAAFRHEDGIDFSILLERAADYAYFRIRAVGTDDPADDDSEYLFEDLLGVMSLSCALAKFGKSVAMYCEDSDLTTQVQIESGRSGSAA
ncbi:MAG: hypothetical protein AAFZ74_01980 [Pseudomonadota bacterium]